MRIVSFHKVGMENFCCFKEEMTLTFEKGKLVLITGPNGSGKTTLFDSIPYTLYGVTSKGLRGDDVVNNEVGKNCHTWLEFSINDTKYRVERFCKHSKHGNNVFLYRDGVLLKKGHSEVLPEVEKILVPQKLFMNTLLFSQKVKTFFTDLTDSEQKEIFRKVLQLDDFVVWYNETNEEIKKLSSKELELENEKNVQEKLSHQLRETISKIEKQKENFYEEKEKNISRIQDKIKSLKSSLSETEEKLSKLSPLESLEQKQKEVEKEVVSYQFGIEESNNYLKSLLETIRNQAKLLESEILKKRQEEISSVIQKRDSEILENSEKLQKQLTSVVSEVSSLEKEVTKLDGDYKVLESKKKTLEIEIKKLSNLDSKKAICPTCKQTITTETLQELLTHKEESEKSLLDIISSMEVVSKTVKSLQDQLTLLASRKTELESMLKEEKLRVTKKYDLEVERIDLQSKQQIEKLSKSLQEKVEEAKTKNEERIRELRLKLEELEVVRNEVSKSIQEVRSLLEEKRKYETELSIKESQLKDLEKTTFDETTINSFKKELQEVEEKKESLEKKLVTVKEEKEIVSFWKEAFSSSGIPSMLIDDAIPFMNATISKYLEEIGGRYVVSFDTQLETKAGEFRDKIAVRTLDTKTKADSRKKLSGGQTRIVDIATVLTLCDLQSNIQDVKFNIMLFDEIFDSLDDENIINISNLLRSLISDKSIYIISHRHIDQIESDEIIRFF